MVYPSIHSLLVLSGPLFTGERWSIGLRMTRVSPAASVQTDAARAAPIFAAVRNYWAGNFGVGNQAKLDLIKVNTIATTGKYLHPWTILEEQIPPVSPQGGASAMPPQVSCVVTLETGATRGLASRGRIFLPAPIANVGTDGRMVAAPRDAILAGARGFINAVNGAAGGDRVIVASDVREGAARAVTSVAVGLVLDTMRSRRASLEEDRASLPVAAPA